MISLVERTLGQQLLDLAGWYPIISVTGPRQSGKSTLVQATFPRYHYVNLEDPATRSRANTDPTGFITALPEQTIIDEAQYAPELFSAIQAKADARKQPGQYILTGSQNFLLLRSIKQSLAGRVGIAYLLPLSFAEIATYKQDAKPIDIIQRGSYPALHATDVPSRIFYENYLDTYITRDVMGYLDVRKERDFRRFLIACATRAGKLVNYADLARDVGISVPTARAWLSILESSFVIHTLKPYSANISKRLTKTPKLYFFDTGLLCHLLSIPDGRSLVESTGYGPIFENYVISEQLKRHFNALTKPDMMFYRDDSKIEVDLVDATDSANLTLCEIKSGQTYRSSFARNLSTVANNLGLASAELDVVYGGEGGFSDGSANVFGVHEWLTRE